ncbi:hypothetical protein [Paraburkholderia humisilvae]|uniref:hypothetical protein n=1 Tax=Paraburkholderia humisilvae TaxID=627669 RepID=UPI00158165A7|nr:hypothetical protein [Paraburkholderia humisilvae]
MELLNDRVYSKSQIESWLVETAQVKPQSQAWKKALTARVGTIVAGDTYLFVPVSETHYRVSRANAEQVAEIFKLVEEATGIRKMKRQWYVCAAIFVSGVVILIGAMIFQH